MRQLWEYDAKQVLPDMIQIERNPLRVCREEIAWCHAKGISVQAYSPLCKMHERVLSNPALQQIAEKYEKNIGQVVLSWQMDTGVIPVFTSAKASRIEEYTCLHDFSLTDEEIETISQMNEDYKMYLEACACPGF